MKKEIENLTKNIDAAIARRVVLELTKFNAKSEVDRIDLEKSFKLKIQQIKNLRKILANAQFLIAQKVDKKNIDVFCQQNCKALNIAHDIVRVLANVGGELGNNCAAGVLVSLINNEKNRQKATTHKELQADQAFRGGAAPHESQVLEILNFCNLGEFDKKTRAFWPNESGRALLRKLWVISPKHSAFGDAADMTAFKKAGGVA